MIRFEPTVGTRFSIAGVSDFSQLPADGQLTRIQVIEKAGEGLVRVCIGGKVLVATGASGFPPGSEFDAKIRYSGSTVFIHPVSNTTEQNIFMRLGIPQTAVTSFLLSFFQTANYRLDSGIFRLLISLSSRFPGKETRAAEAAAILLLQGIDPDERLIALMMEIIEGNAGGSEGGERDILAFINQKKGHERHWLTYPFKRIIEGRTLTGSIRFLIDTALETMIRTVITVNDGQRKWDFTLEDQSCTYTHTPDPDTVTADKIVVCLKQVLEQAGTTRVERASSTDGEVYSGIDVEI